MSEEAPQLPYVVPGAYLLRAGELSVEEVRDELRGSGLVFIRRFLAHTARSDYLVIFDPKVLVTTCKVEQETPKLSGETPAGSWAALALKAPDVVEAPKKAVEVVAEAPKSQPKTEEAESDLFRATGSKNVRPGRRARQMLRDLKAASVESVPKTSEAPPVVVLRPLPLVKSEPPPKMTQIPLGANLIVSGHSVFRLRPFRVGDTMEMQSADCGRPGTANLITVPHLTVYHPPRAGFVPRAPGVRNRVNDTLALAHVERCRAWIKQVIESLVTCGLLSSTNACRVMNAHMDASRISRVNLVSLQCRFSDEVPIQARNAVYAVLRSSVWFQSLSRDPALREDEEPYLVRCWWRQVPAAD